MKYLFKTPPFVVLLLSVFCSFYLPRCYAQEEREYGTGALFDPEKLLEIPEVASVMRGSLPARASMRNYCPTPGDQGSTGTCTAWATAYAARTMLMAKRMNLSGQAYIDNYAFSPSFVYNQIREKDGCMEGTFISSALNVLKYKGVPLYKDFGYECARGINVQDILKAREYTIKNYSRLYLWSPSQAPVDLVFKIKRSISEGKPVVISMAIFSSLEKAKGVWMPLPPGTDQSKGNHAVTVVGYDDNMYGGAFEIMNSWGSAWGNNGFIWVRYSDMERLCREALELEDQVPESRPVEDMQFSGSVKLVEQNGRPMAVQMDRGMYRTRNAYLPGTTFQCIVTHKKPVYLYVFGIDQSNTCTLLFPYNKYISPMMNYSQSSVALPGLDHYIQIDNALGSEYLCMIYSRTPININQIIKQMEESYGAIPDRLNLALGGLAVSPAQVKYQWGESAFSSNFAQPSSGTAVPIIIEIKKK